MVRCSFERIIGLDEQANITKRKDKAASLITDVQLALAFPFLDFLRSRSLPLPHVLFYLRSILCLRSLLHLRSLSLEAMYILHVPPFRINSPGREDLAALAARANLSPLRGAPNFRKFHATRVLHVPVVPPAVDVPLY